MTPDDGKPGQDTGARHRGPHPRDRELFAATELTRLRLATNDLCWLLDRGYVVRSSLKLVGDRHALTQRQRVAVARAACDGATVAERKAKSAAIETLTGTDLAVDGFNQLITVETALSGGVLLLCRDGCVRDLASIHGSYRTVNETERALRLIGEVLAESGPSTVTWLLDRPVSNSGRLAHRIEDLAQARGWPWKVRVVYNPDAAIKESGAIAVSSDSAVIDGVGKWVNLTAHVLQRHLPHAWVIDLR